MEKFVYLVTPDYMLPFIEESKLYSFFIKAYPNAKSGYRNLIQTNLSSILGFVFFYEELPEDLTYLVKFINFLNIVGDKDTLVLLAVNDPDGVKDFLLPKLDTDKITFKFITGFEIVTDSFIKRSLLGTIVLHNFEPYIEEAKPIKEVATFNRNESLNPILPSDVLSILSPIIKLNNSDNTIKHDVVLNNVTGNGLLMYMRINYIKASFGDEIDIDGMLRRINSVDGLNVIVYNSIVNTISKLYERTSLDINYKDINYNELDESSEDSNELNEKSLIEPNDVIDSVVDNVVDNVVNELEDSIVDSVVNELEDDFLKPSKSNSTPSISGGLSEDVKPNEPSTPSKSNSNSSISEKISNVIESGDEPNGPNEPNEPSNPNGDSHSDLFDYDNMFNYGEDDEEEDKKKLSNEFEDDLSDLY